MKHPLARKERVGEKKAAGGGQPPDVLETLARLHDTHSRCRSAHHVILSGGGSGSIIVRLETVSGRRLCSTTTLLEMPGMVGGRRSGGAIETACTMFLTAACCCRVGSADINALIPGELVISSHHRTLIIELASLTFIDARIQDNSPHERGVQR